MLDSMYELVSTVAQPTDYYQRLLYVMDGGCVSRFHTVDLIKPPSVGLHSFEVAWLAFLISPKPVRVNLILACLAHDLPEVVYGDVPGPTKDGEDSTQEMQLNINNCCQFPLEDIDRKILKIADKMAVLFTCIKERRLGNRNMEAIWVRQTKKIRTMIKSGTPEDRVLQAFEEHWNKVVTVG